MEDEDEESHESGLSSVDHELLKCIYGPGTIIERLHLFMMIYI